jgi:hypothetical protein
MSAPEPPVIESAKELPVIESAPVLPVMVTADLPAVMVDAALGAVAVPEVSIPEPVVAELPTVSYSLWYHGAMKWHRLLKTLTCAGVSASNCVDAVNAFNCAVVMDGTSCWLITTGSCVIVKPLKVAGFIASI